MLRHGCDKLSFYSGTGDAGLGSGYYPRRLLWEFLRCPHLFGKLSHFDPYGVWSFGRFHGMVLCTFHFLNGSIDILIPTMSYVLLPPNSLFTKRYVVYAIHCAA